MSTLAAHAQPEERRPALTIPEEVRELRQRMAVVEAEMMDTKTMREDITEIRKAIVGDEALGHRGLVARLSSTERILYVIIAALLVIGGERAFHLFFPAA